MMVWVVMMLALTGGSQRRIEPPGQQRPAPEVRGHVRGGYQPLPVIVERRVGGEID